MALTVPAPSWPAPAPCFRRRRRLAVLATLAAVAVAVAAATGTWIATRSHGSHHALPDMCAAVAAVEGVPVVPGPEPSTCAWPAGTTSFTLAATLYQRTRWDGAGERADDAFRYEQGGAVDRAADGSGWPPAYRAMPGTANAAFCLGPDDGQRLLALPGELVWASTWMGKVNEVVAPRLGLPMLPFVDWPDDDAAPKRGAHCKDRIPDAVGSRTRVRLAR